jgi:lipopolysaccharide transport system permease protein
VEQTEARTPPGPDPRPVPPPQTGQRSSLGRDLRELTRDLLASRELLLELTRRDLRIRYKQAVMGVAWAVLTPLVVALSGWVLRLAFSYMAGVPIVRAELAGIAVKSIGWSFFVGALGFGTGSITANLPLVTKVYFPRAVLPMSTVATQLVDSAIGAAALILLLPFFGVHLSIALLWLPLLVLLLVLFTSGAVLLAGAGNVFYRDARHLVQLVTSFGIFFTPVFYDAGAFGVRGVGLLLLNPLGPILEGMRLVVVQGHDLRQPLAGIGGTLIWSPWYLAWSAGWAVALLLGSAVIFRRVEFAFAEYV